MPIYCDALDCDGRFAAGLIAGADEVPGLKTEAGFQKGSAANSDRLVGHLRASQSAAPTPAPDFMARAARGRSSG